MNSEKFLLLCVFVLLVGIIGCLLYTIIINTRKNEGLIQAQIEASKHKKSDHVTTLSYDAVKKIISDLIAIYASQLILISDLKNKKPDELSIIIDDSVITICANVWNAMSEELRTAALFYVSEKHLKIVIKDEARLSFVARLAIK